MKCFLFMTLVMLAITFSANAQTKTDTVTNNTVLQLKAAGLSADIIKAKIQGSLCRFDLSTDALVTLRKLMSPTISLQPC
jgi:hypothetical protein